jgi:putative ABC transport system permease protein
LQPGDELHLLVGNRRQRVVVTGTAISSEFVYMVGPGTIAPDPANFGVLYLKRSFAEEIFDMHGGANQVVGQLAPQAPPGADELLARAERLLEPFGVLATTARKDQVSHMFLDNEIKGLGVFANILPGIFLAVAALVLSVLMSRLVDQQRSVIGTLKAIGYSDRAVFVHFLKFGLALGMFGGAAGCVGGYAMADAILIIYQRFFEFPKLENRLYPGIYWFGMAISVGCSLLGSLRGAAAALRLRPAEAMRVRPPVPGGRIWLERLGFLWNHLAFPQRMALRNVVRNRLRTAVGLLAAATGTSLLVVGFMAVEAMDFLVEFQFEKITRSDLDLAFEAEQGDNALWEAKRLPGVQHAEAVLHVSCTFAHGHHRRQGSITGLALTRRLTTPRDATGQELRIPDAGLLLTHKLAELLHVSVGDVLAVTPTKGLQRTVHVPVAEIAESYLGTSAYAEIAYLSRLVGESVTLSGVQLAVQGDGATWQSLYRELKNLPALQTASARQDMIDNINETILETQDISITILVVFAGVIFFGSILNASLVGMAERLREIATLHVLGYGPWQIGGLLLRESMLVNLLGTTAGLPLGYLLYLAMAEAYDNDLIRLPIVAPPWVWMATVTLAILFALAAHGVVQWKIHHTDWRAALLVSE